MANNTFSNISNQTTPRNATALNTTQDFTEEFLSERVLRRVKFRVGRLTKKFHLNSHDYEDLMQDFQVALISAAREYDPSKGVVGAMVTGTLNKMYKWKVRQFKTQQRLGFDDAMGFDDIEEGFDETFVEPSQEHELALAELRMDVESILETLTPTQRRLSLLLREHSPAEAAEILGIRRNNVYRTMERIKQAFVEAGYDVEEKNFLCRGTNCL